MTAEDFINDPIGRDGGFVVGANWNDGNLVAPVGTTMMATRNDHDQDNAVPSYQHQPEARLTLGDIDTDAVDAKLLDDLKNLCFVDRNRINEEVHGVLNLASNESPAIVQTAFWMLEQEIRKIQNKPAYDQAKYVLRSAFIEDHGLRLRCLRSTLFDVKEAARRFTSYLDLCLDYFGPESLTRPIRMSDLGKDEIELLRTGEYQILPFRDRSGRRVIACVAGVGLKFSLYTRVSHTITPKNVLSAEIICDMSHLNPPPPSVRGNC